MVQLVKRKERLDRGIKVRTEDIYAVSSLQEIAYMLAPRLILILGLLLAPLIVGDMYWQRVICIMGIYALLSLAFDFLAHFAGIVCLGGALFVGMGGYIAGALNSSFGLPPILTIPIGTVSGAVISTVLLLPCIRLRGIYFAIVSFLYPLIFARAIAPLDIFGGTDGLSGLDTFPNLWVDQYIIIFMTLIFLFGTRRLVEENFGIVLRGVKDNDQTVEASGISVTKYKIISVFYSSIIGCFAGAYLAHLYGWVGISLFAMDFTILPIACTVLGGMGTLVGPVLGAFILTPISEVLRAFGTFRIVFYCVILVAFIIYKPEGLMGYMQRKYSQFERWMEV